MATVMKIKILSELRQKIRKDGTKFYHASAITSESTLIDVYSKQVVKSMTRKFKPRLQCIQSATGENLTEVAQIADRWKWYCEDLYHDEERNGNQQEYWEKEPLPLRSEVAHAIRQTATRKAQQNCSKQEDRQHWTECTEYVWRSGKLVSGQRNGRSPHSSHFPRKVILNSVKTIEQLLWFPIQARFFFGSYWKGPE